MLSIRITAVPRLLFAFLFVALAVFALELFNIFQGWGLSFLPWLSAGVSFGASLCSIYIIYMASRMPWKFLFLSIGAITFFTNSYAFMAVIMP